MAGGGIAVAGMDRLGVSTLLTLIILLGVSLLGTFICRLKIGYPKIIKGFFHVYLLLFASSPLFTSLIHGSTTEQLTKW